MAGEQQRVGRTLILTGASRGIGHATVKCFSSAGWRVMTCSRQPFPQHCPWQAGPEDHIIYSLCSAQASYVTGTEVHINGGQHL